MKKQGSPRVFKIHEAAQNESMAVAWFEARRWPNGRYCPHCGSTNTVKVGRPQPYRCKEKGCRKHFSCKTGTLMQSSKLPVKKWLHAVHLMSINRNGLSSIQLGHELGIEQETAWRLGHKIRKAWNQNTVLRGGQRKSQTPSGNFSGYSKS